VKLFRDQIAIQTCSPPEQLRCAEVQRATFEAVRAGDAMRMRLRGVGVSITFMHTPYLARYAVVVGVLIKRVRRGRIEDEPYPSQSWGADLKAAGGDRRDLASIGHRQAI
jgi:hypothetical protein